MKGAARWTLRLKASARDSPRALMRPGLDVETVIVESKLGILRDRVLVGGREIAVRRGRHGWRLVVGARGGVGRVQYDGWWTDSRFSPRSARWRFDSSGATRRSHGGGGSSPAARCSANQWTPSRAAEPVSSGRSPRGGGRFRRW